MPGRLSAIVLCVSVLLIAGDAPAASKTIRKPMFNGHRLDWCLKWSSDCGKPAADAYCKAQGYVSAIDFSPDKHIGSRAPTRLIGTGAICDLAYCDGFGHITCEKMPIATPAAKAVPPKKPLMLRPESARIERVAYTPPVPPSKPAMKPAGTTAAASAPAPQIASKPAEVAKPAAEVDPIETGSVSGATALPSLPPPPKLFVKPMYNGKRLDWCHSWDKDCGQVAADAFCKTNGYSRAKAFERDPHIGDAHPTRVMANGAVCDQAVCNGFKAITCTM